MGGCCVEKRAYLTNEDEKLLLHTSNAIIDPNNFKTNDINEEFLINFYNKCTKDHNLEGLFKLLDNKSLIIVNDFSHEWISLPKMMGDLCLYHIMTILKIHLVIDTPLDEKKFDLYKEQNINYIAFFNENEYISQFIIRNSLIKKMFHILHNGSYSQKDTCLIILCDLSLNKRTCSFLKNKVTLDTIIAHLRGFYIKKYKNFIQHVIYCLRILRNIYVQDEQLRKYFIEVQGINFLEGLLKTKNKNYSIINEILFNIEDLIYREDDILNKEYNSLSKIIITEIIDLLVKMKLPEVLFNFYNENFNDEKILEMKNEFTRLLTIFSTRIDKN